MKKTDIADVDALIALLDAKEARAQRQKAQLKLHSLPLICVTAVMPGVQKCSSLANEIVRSAHIAVNYLLENQSWACAAQHFENPVSGPEWLISVDADAKLIKQAMVHLEEMQPLGRLWDLDVITPEGEQVSRIALGFVPRRCLLCEDSAHFCARTHRHSTHELLWHIKCLVDDVNNRNH